MKLITWAFLIMMIGSLAVLTIVRVTENEWYENIEGQCGINDNGTCEGWQSSVIIISLFSFFGLLILFLISRSYEEKSDANVALSEGGEEK